MAELVHSFHASFYTRRAKRDFDLLKCRKSYLVTAEVINFHVSFDLAMSSGPFGSLSGESIQLVRVFNSTAIQKHYHLWCLERQRDYKPEAFFASTMYGEHFKDHLQRWGEDMNMLWLWHKWYRAKESNFADLEERKRFGYNTGEKNREFLDLQGVPELGKR